MTSIAQHKEKRAVPWLLLVLLAGSFLLFTGFFLGFALPYLALEEEVLQRFEGRQFWILSHIVTGSVALLIGPFQLWMGISGKVESLHRQLGVTYLMAIGLSSVSAFYLAATTQVTWAFRRRISWLGSRMGDNRNFGIHRNPSTLVSAAQGMDDSKLCRHTWVCCFSNLR